MTYGLFFTSHKVAAIGQQFDGIFELERCEYLKIEVLLLQEELFIKFAEFEEKVGEADRARAIYKYALDHIPRSQADNVYTRFVAFEKQHGDRDGIEVSLCNITLFHTFL